jgi:hypothetical protein
VPLSGLAGCTGSHGWRYFLQNVPGDYLDTLFGAVKLNINEAPRWLRCRRVSQMVKRFVRVHSIECSSNLFVVDDTAQSDHDPFDAGSTRRRVPSLESIHLKPDFTTRAELNGPYHRTIVVAFHSYFITAQDLSA